MISIHIFSVDNCLLQLTCGITRCFTAFALATKKVKKYINMKIYRFPDLIRIDLLLRFTSVKGPAQT